LKQDVAWTTQELSRLEALLIGEASTRDQAFAAVRREAAEDADGPTTVALRMAVDGIPLAVAGIGLTIAGLVVQASAQGLP
jgi:hypothetical protein